MTEDARFEDGRETPLNLGAFDEEDLKILSALVQDAVFPAVEMQWRAKERRFALLLNRFRWEDQGQTRHGAERVQSVLSFATVTAVSSSGIDRSEKETVLSLLAIEWHPGAEAPEGDIHLVLAGDGVIRLRVEAIEATLKDVTRPYKAPSRRAPDHDL
ncbi:MAG: DUF2948 family protein [Rhodobacteraceae bacterium]|jgi:hypothetical protein|nr:DUF2948 family protein [Paracoccaceae bacterium]